MLRSLGYKVLSADDGLMAVDMFREHADEVDLVLLDVVMPMQNGRESAARMLALRPETKIVFATGYDKAEALEGLGGDVLHKPYSISRLSQVIRRRLSTQSRNVRLRTR